MSEQTFQKRYHHGDLRRAILEAAEAEIAQSGLSGFSLRKVAARVGVSHTAPAHHFGDAAGVINALAEDGFHRLLASMQRRQALAVQTPHERLIASGLGYLEFALTAPAMFRLIFALPEKPRDDSALFLAGQAAYQHLQDAVIAFRGQDEPGALRAEVLACWTRVHGLADLILTGYIDLPDGVPQAEACEDLFRQVVAVDLAP